MYRNLAPQALGLSSCPLHELVELALTHRFGGLDIDFEDFLRQVEVRGIQAAKRYLSGTNLKVATLQLPMEWDLHEEDYPQQVERLRKSLSIVKELGCKTLVTHVPPGSNFRIYHENFEFHRRRLSEIAEILREHDIRLGLTFSAVASEQAEFSQPFVSTFEGLTTLLRIMTTENVGIVFDSWHWALSEGTLNQLEQLGAARICDVRLADLPTNDATPETIRPEERLLPEATSRLEFGSIIEVLKRMEYRGPITPYPHPSQFNNQRRDQVVKRVAESLEILLGPMNAAGHRGKAVHA